MKRGNLHRKISEVVAEDGTIVDHYEYSPFGQLTKKISNPNFTFRNPFMFSSEYHDEETELVYYNHRYYIPKLGCWTKRDPIGEQGGLNLYAMVANDPIGSWDSLGLANGWKRSVVWLSPQIIRLLAPLTASKKGFQGGIRAKASSKWDKKGKLYKLTSYTLKGDIAIYDVKKTWDAGKGMYHVGEVPVAGSNTKTERVFMTKSVYLKGRKHEEGHAEDTYKIYNYTVKKVQSAIASSNCYFKSKAKALKYFGLVRNTSKGARTYLPSEFISLFNKANKARDKKQFLSTMGNQIVVGGWDDSYVFQINQ